MKLNKRGQGLSTNAIILIILGVFVLAILILGFTLGWSKLAPWISTNNVGTIVTSCKVACDTRSQYDFCGMERELKAGDFKDNKKIATGTCNAFSDDSNKDDFQKYGIEKCPSITCPDDTEEEVTLN